MNNTQLFMESISQLGLTQTQFEAIGKLYSACFEGTKINSPANKETVTEFQNFLKSLGANIKVDGVYGTSTRAAARAAFKTASDEDKKKISAYMNKMRNAVANVGTQKSSTAGAFDQARQASADSMQKLSGITKLRGSAPQGNDSEVG